MHSQSCSTTHCNNLWLGLVAFVIGAVILLQKFDVVPETTWGWLWPIILVVVGLKLMLSGAYTSDCCGTCEEPKKMEKPAKKPQRKAKKKTSKKKK